MQTHSAKSAELVGIISKFHGFIQESVRHHQNAGMGRGIHMGLSERSIPLGSRIILIADTIDAMTTDRPYRKRLPLEVVIAELQKCKGTQFDPELVDVVVASVAVRRLIGGATAAASVTEVGPLRSKRVSWPTGGIWKRSVALPCLSSKSASPFAGAGPQRHLVEHSNTLSSSPPSLVSSHQTCCLAKLVH